MVDVVVVVVVDVDLDGDDDVDLDTVVDEESGLRRRPLVGGR